MKKIKKILIIIQRSNGDVFFSSSLIRTLYEQLENPEIDLLVNDDTISIANLIPFISKIHTFSYQEKMRNRWKQEKNIIFNIYKKYDLSINLTASDRSVFYSIISGRKSISAVEIDNTKSWWKKIMLSNYYFFNEKKHILKNNLESLNILKIHYESIQQPIEISRDVISSVKKKLNYLKVEKFIIFHPSTQYEYKMYPEKLRTQLLFYLNEMKVPIIVTGGDNSIDIQIKNQLPELPFIIDFIGETSLEECMALSELSLGYIGMDTLNMHLAASQSKRIFAIFGPTKLKMWSPWSNDLKLCATQDQPIQTYGNVTIFQANMACVACGKAGCDDNHSYSDCLEKIEPKIIFNEVKNWYLESNNKISIETQ